MKPAFVPLKDWVLARQEHAALMSRLVKPSKSVANPAAIAAYRAMQEQSK